MRDLPLCAAMCLVAAGCTGPAPPPAAAVRASAVVMQKLPVITCAEDPPIPAHAAKPGQQDDRANAYDTPETVAAIEKHNATRKAVCP